jgi:Homeodomain-like domain
MDGLYDEPRPGAPREIGDDEIAATIRETLETRPKGATHWSLRSMAKEIGHAPSTVHRIWQAFGLQPHRVETFKLSSDPLFVEKVRDIVGLYLSPPQRAVVLCVDEKSQVHLPRLPQRWKRPSTRRLGLGVGTGNRKGRRECDTNPPPKFGRTIRASPCHAARSVLAGGPVGLRCFRSFLGNLLELRASPSSGRAHHSSHRDAFAYRDL